ncbi:hypothetical protein [Clostridium sp. AWRP]|uniref:hypothetical protein n=1 Tax=Clostridium sp. AWRP TaxID=2212991 RepID=UPI000FDC2FC4|nr:hypothetical protein [Clostridium sp. AWRP]AZV56597.1 hypothetical protein DMR38_08260 [Clostridium sp. AWRP]
MDDNKDFIINNNCSGEDEDKKLVNKFLTIKEVPDKIKKKRHFEKMLEVFHNTEEQRKTDMEELSDDEIDSISAAGTGCVGCQICPYCHKMIRADLLEIHKLTEHKKI